MGQWIQRVSIAAAALFGASEARADTIIMYADPMTLDRKVVVRKAPGPDTFILCMLPPSEAGCTRVPARAAR